MAYPLSLITKTSTDYQNIGFILAEKEHTAHHSSVTSVRLAMGMDGKIMVVTVVRTHCSSNYGISCAEIVFQLYCVWQQVATEDGGGHLLNNMWWC